MPNLKMVVFKTNKEIRATKKVAFTRMAKEIAEHQRALEWMMKATNSRSSETRTPITLPRLTCFTRKMMMTEAMMKTKKNKKTVLTVTIATSSLSKLKT